MGKLVGRILKIPKIDANKESFFVKKSDVHFLVETLTQFFSKMN